MTVSSAQQASADNGPRGRYLYALAFGALGVVYGDIGTSPLYALRETFHGPHAIAVTHGNVLGVLSLIFWSLVLIVSVKYLGFVLRADNRGEGGIVALMALVHQRRPGTRRWVVIMLSLFGAALLYGDGIITPAISVLSAVEGLQVAAPVLSLYIIPITLVILVCLFLLQRRGTAAVGKMFGPVMVLWFLSIGALGVVQIVRHPGVLTAISPHHAVGFFMTNGWRGFVVLGAVFLVVTGAEALYADMGHFGRRPIRLAWFAMAFPALLLNYFGQGALLLFDPAAAENPFYHLAPSWALYPMIALATMAATIASQAVITGAYSLTRQLMQLGYSPRMQVEHTSHQEMGQIYMPGVNWVMMVLTIALVLEFGSSSRLAAAYGMAVSNTMIITSLMLYVVAREIWGWRRVRAGMICGGFLLVDAAYLGANVIKIPDGGWFPLVAAIAIYLLMTTWKRGREILYSRLQERSIPWNMLIADLAADPPLRVPGTAVFMTGNPGATPPALVHNLTHNKVLHETVVFMSVVTESVPHVPPGERVEVEALGKSTYSVVAHYGFMDDPSVNEILSSCRPEGLKIEIPATTFFMGRETLIATDRPGMARWRERLFAFMSRNAMRATAFYQIPTEQVFEVGAQVEL